MPAGWASWNARRRPRPSRRPGMRRPWGAGAGARACAGLAAAAGARPRMPRARNPLRHRRANPSRPARSWWPSWRRSTTTAGWELRRVRRTLSQIGSVNPFAVEEHRELSGAAGGPDHPGRGPGRRHRRHRRADRAAGHGHQLALQRRLRGHRRAVRRLLPPPVRRRVGIPAARRRRGRGGARRHRDRGPTSRQAAPAPGHAVRRRAGADRGGAAVRDAERQPGAVLHPGRGRCGPRRGEHRPLRRRAAAAVRGRSTSW